MQGPSYCVELGTWRPREKAGGGGERGSGCGSGGVCSQPLMETDGAGTGTAERSRHPKAPLSLCARWPGAFGVPVRGPEPGAAGGDGGGGGKEEAQHRLKRRPLLNHSAEPRAEEALGLRGPESGPPGPASRRAGREKNSQNHYQKMRARSMTTSLLITHTC